jgi:hypothetical protein
MKKLTLTKETLRDLSKAELDKVVGASGHPSCNPSCAISCTCPDPTDLCMTEFPC